MNQIELLISRYPSLNVCVDDISKAISVLIKTFESGGTLLVCGNGGSYSDAEHIVGELMKGFHKKRPLPADMKASLLGVDKESGNKLANKLQQPLRAISLMGMQSLTTAVSNDIDAGLTVAQQTLAFADKKSTLLGISTSGNAGNILAAAVVAKAKGSSTVGLTGACGGGMNELFDIIVKVPETETYKIQELHTPVYHTICLAVEEHFFNE